MREIRFRAWDKQTKLMYPEWQLHPEFGVLLNDKRFEVMQYTGLKDKNGLQDVYEGDIIGWHGLVEGNIYEHSNLLKEGANLIIEGFGTKAWLTTYPEAVARGCKDAE